MEIWGEVKSSGLVNNLRALLGLERIAYLGDAIYFRHMYVWSGIWQSTGWSAIIYISALAGVSPELPEAAVVEGASKLQKIINIDIPHILPTAITILIMNTGHLLSVGFEKVFLMQNALITGSTATPGIGYRDKEFQLQHFVQTIPSRAEQAISECTFFCS